MRQASKVDEYYPATTQRLYRYPQYLAMLNTAIINRDTALAKIGDVNRPISRYQERTAPTSDGLTGPENYVAAQDRAKVDYWRACKTIEQLQNIIQPIAESLSVLDEDETKIVCLRFWGIEAPSYLKLFDSDGLKGKKWEEMECYGYSRRNAIRICTRAQWNIRNMIFPCRQDEGTGIIAIE